MCQIFKMKLLYPLLVLFLSVIFGYFVAVIFKPNKHKILKLLMAFSGSFLLALTIFHLLPEVYQKTDTNAGIFIMLGILFQIILEFFSKGAEHGHVHKHDKTNKTPWLLFISLCIHAFLEGFPIEAHHELSYGIAIHHFPIAIILTLFFLNSKLNPVIIFLFMFSFALMSPIGTITAENFTILAKYHTQLTAIVIGILFHISSTIIFESSENHKFNILKISMIIFGVVIGYFI